MSINREKNLINVPAIFAILVFIFLASADIYSPSLYYDEVLFVNAAFGGESDLFIYKRILGIPVMLMPYIGALKAWLYFPIFNFFSANQITIRLPMILIGAATLFINYCIVNKLFGRCAATIFIILSAVEPSTIFHTRIDWGPTTLMMFFRALSILFLITFIQKRDIKYGIFFVLFTVVGIFDKANFIWIPVAIMLAYIFTSSIKLRIKIIIYLLFILFLFSITFFTNEIALPDFDKFQKNLNIFLMVLSGEDVFNFVTGRYIQGAYIQLCVVIFSFLVSMFAIMNLAVDGNLKKSITGIAVFSISIFCEILVTRQANGPHHLAMLAPIWLIFISVGLNLIGNKKTNFRYAFFNGKGVSILLFFLIMLSSLNVSNNYHEQLSKDVKHQWSVALENLVTKTKNYSRQSKFIFVDWGGSTIFQALTQNQFTIYDFWPWFKDGFYGDKLRYFNSNFLSNEMYYVVPTSDYTNMASSRENFIKMNSDNKWNLKPIDTIFDEKNMPAFEIYSTAISDKLIPR